jgi:protein ImuB
LPPGAGGRADPQTAAAREAPCPLRSLAPLFSPRYERHGDDLLSIDVSGLERLLGAPRAIGEELRREAAARGLRVHVAIAGRRVAALLLAVARPGLSVVAAGEEAAALAPLRIEVLEKIAKIAKIAEIDELDRIAGASASAVIPVLRSWGVRTLGRLATLPAADLAARLGPTAGAYQAMARGADVRPLVPDVPEERFEAALALDWPIEGLEPLSFVLTRLLEPLSTRLERCDRGAAVLHVMLRLVTAEIHARRLELPSPIRDVRTLRTLALLDLESHPPSAAIDGVTIVIDPMPGRVLQHTLFARAQPAPEQISTLLARLGALLGSDRLGAPALVESHRPGAFTMKPFGREPPSAAERAPRRAPKGGEGPPSGRGAPPESPLVSALRRCRPPIPARVVLAHGRPVRVTTDRRGYAGGAVVSAAGPWRVSGEWWQPDRYSRDEWDVALVDGAVYRIVLDRERGGWVLDAIVD